MGSSGFRSPHLSQPSGVNSREILDAHLQCFTHEGGFDEVEAALAALVFADVALSNYPARRFRKRPVKLPSGETVTLSPGGQNPLIKQVVEKFCPRFAPGATVVYIGDADFMGDRSLGC
jgi:hypothetical protein